MLTALERYAVETTYTSTARFVTNRVVKFHSQHGGDFSELLSRAGVHFMRAYQSYDPAKGAFTTWLGRKIWYGLLDDRRQEAIERSRSPVTCWENVPDRQEEPPAWDSETFLTRLSRDARAVVRLVLAETFASLGVNGNSPDTIREGLRDYLRKRGWKEHRIEKTFREIKINL